MNMSLSALFLSILISASKQSQKVNIIESLLKGRFLPLKKKKKQKIIIMSHHKINNLYSKKCNNTFNKLKIKTINIQNMKNIPIYAQVVEIKQ